MPNNPDHDRLAPRCAAELMLIFAAGAWALPAGCFSLLRRCGCHVSTEELPYWLLGFTILSTSAGFFYLFLKGIPLKPLFGAFPHKKEEWKMLLLLLLLLLLGVAVVSSLWKQLLDAFSIPYQEQQPLLALAGTFSHPALAALFLAAAVLTPVNEELLFRKLLFDWLLLAGRTTAWIGTAAVFSAVHLFLYGVPGFFLMGIVFQYARKKNGSLWSCILLHAFVNTVAICATVLQGRQ